MMTIRWIRFGIVAGLAASTIYPLLIVGPLPAMVLVILAGLLGPAIGVASLGLREILLLGKESVSAHLAAVFNFAAGALFTAMILVQLAVRMGQGEWAQLVAVWLGVDVAWDVYIALGTLLFAVAMERHPRFGRWFAWPGLVLSVALLALNFYTFPIPPAEAGLIDLGPAVGLWYLAVTLQTWRSLPWARQRVVEASRQERLPRA